MIDAYDRLGFLYEELQRIQDEIDALELNGEEQYIEKAQPINPKKIKRGVMK